MNAAILFQEAVELHARGALAEAAVRYAEVLAVDPNHIDALYRLGRALCQQGRFADGIGLFSKLIAIEPNHAAAHDRLGMALDRLGRSAEALESFERAIACDPNFADAWANKADALSALGRHAEAIESYERAIAIVPDLASAWCNRGVALHEAGRHKEALSSFDRAVANDPALAEAHANRGKTLKTLGRQEESLDSYDRAIAIRLDVAEFHSDRALVLKELQRPEDALSSVERAVSLDPGSSVFLINRAAVLCDLGRAEEALASCDNALRLAPHSAVAHCMRGNALADLNRHREAIASYERAIALKLDYAEAHFNFANTLQHLDRHDNAFRHYDRAIALRPGYAEASWNKCLLDLTLGRFAEGWDLYEQCREPHSPVRRLLGAPDAREYPQPPWDGEPMKGALLLRGEQGLGDQILYAGMVPELNGLAQSIVLEVEPRLVQLFARSFPGVKLVGSGDELYAGWVDAQVPLGSLGKHLRPGWGSFPRREHGYLVPERTRAMKLRDRLASDGRTVVGLSWISVNPRIGMSKSARLRDFESLLRLPGCRFVDLQYGDTRAERATIERELGVRIERLDEIDNTNDIDGLAALISACDTVVTVSNTTAHLAGAVGALTFVLVPFGHARLWYWFKGKDESPWYPRVRVRRQAIGKPWAELISSLTPEISSPIRTPK